ncbi:MAG: hypothetical protein NT027_18635 [Proteobacteria bacterium]|nr:hypothetical protein [Pseudomonadota bacterium]
MSTAKNLKDERLLQEGIHIDDLSVDVSVATWDEGLSKVWVHESTGEICATMDRLLFESPLSIAVRFIEPQGFKVNLENLLACIDAMKICVVTKPTTSKTDQSKFVAKRIAPAIYTKLPERNAKGPLLSQFYEEIGKYESELARLQQYEVQSRRAAQAAIKDETGKLALMQLQRDNENLKNEIEGLHRKLTKMATAIEAVPLVAKEGLIPVGLKQCTVRHVNVSENIVHFKSDQGQFSFPLSKLAGLPIVNARALSNHEGGVVRGVWVFDPVPQPFEFSPSEVLSVDETKVKVRLEDRSERVVSLPLGHKVRRNERLVLKLATGVIIEALPKFEYLKEDPVDIVFENQVVFNLSGGSKLSKLISKASSRRSKA